MLPVASSRHYNGNSKNGKNRLLTNARPSGSIPTKPRSLGKNLDAKAPAWGQILVQIPGVRGGMVMDEIDTCINTF